MDISNLTTQAVDRINKLCEADLIYAVCLSLKRSGCAGFEYVWESITDPSSIEKEDCVISTGAGHLVISATSLKFFEGTEIDYVKSKLSSVFEIRNPNATSECGCGVSVQFDTTI